MTSAARWDHRRYGTREDPIRQSDLADIASAYGCPKRFSYRKRADAAGPDASRAREAISGRAANGTAIHATIASYLDDCRSSTRIFGGELPSRDAVGAMYRRALLAAAEGRTITWYDSDPSALAEDAVAMVLGALREVPRRAASIVAVEAPFIAKLDEYWLQGTIDIVYRPRGGAPDAIAFADWKTGQQRMAQILLDHGYQAGIYAHALHSGVLWPDTSRSLEPRTFPSAIHVVHLGDHVPYKKASTKTVSRPEEAEFFGVSIGEKVKTVVGQERGPAWYASRRTLDDIARLRVSIKNIVSTVRLGRFIEAIDEHCDRCPFRGPCLTDGYAVSGEEARQLEQSLRGVELDGLDDVA